MAHLRNVKFHLLLCVIVVSFGCRTMKRRNLGAGEKEPVLEAGTSLESHGVRHPKEVGKAWIPAPALGPIALTPAGEVSFSKKGQRDWFARAGIVGFKYEIAFDEEIGSTWSVGRRITDDGWFLEGEVTVPRAENDFVDRKGGRRREVHDQGRNWFYLLNVGKECYLNEAKNLRWRYHGGVGWWAANSLTENDSSVSLTAGAAIQARLYKDLWGDFGLSYYSMDTATARENDEWRHNLGIHLSLVFDF